MVHRAPEQRRFTRLPMNRPVTLDGPRGRVEGRLRDIGLNGVRLELPGDWAGPADAQYRLRTGLAPGSTLRMGLRLVHRRGASAGFRCTGLDGGSLVQLTGLLRLYHGEESAVQRELDQLDAQQDGKRERRP